LITEFASRAAQSVARNLRDGNAYNGKNWQETNGSSAAGSRSNTAKPAQETQNVLQMATVVQGEAAR